MKPKVLVIVGPTASGKSGLAVKLAKKFKGEVISADSRQVYKGLNIGTGKITKKEMKGVKHHLLDVADPKKVFTVFDYKKLADKVLQYIVVNNRLPIIVGGTGFYIDALVGRTGFADVKVNKVLRGKLNKLSTEKLFQILRKQDPRRAKEIDPRNKVRVIRALEIVAALGKVPPVTSPQPSPRRKEREYIWVGLKPDQKELEKKIYARLIKRLPSMIREANKLRANKLSYKRMESLGLEYRYLALYLQGKLNKSEMVNKLNMETRKYSKRQYTWFKRNKKIKWFNPSQKREIEKHVRSMLG